MKIKFMALFLVLIFSSILLAQSAPPTAAQRVENMANEEAAWRYASGGGKMLFGGLLLGTGIALWNAAQAGLVQVITLTPLSVIVGIPGAALFGWGAADLIFGSREYEDENAKLKLMSEPEKETSALDYLKTKAEKDKKDRQPGFWNGFGLFSMFETPAEREYNSYLKAR